MANHIYPATEDKCKLQCCADADFLFFRKAINKKKYILHTCRSRKHDKIWWVFEFFKKISSEFLD